MSADVLHFSFSLSALTDVFENNEMKNKTTSVYRLREYIACVAGAGRSGRMKERAVERETRSLRPLLPSACYTGHAK